MRRLFFNSLALCISDSLVLLAGLYLGNWLIYRIHGVPVSLQYSLAVLPVWCLGAVLGRAVPAWGLGAVEEFRRIQLLLLIVFGFAGVAVLMSHGRIAPSRIVYGVSWMVGAVFIPVVRISVKKMLFGMGVWGCRTAVYGCRSQVCAVVEDFRCNPQLGYIPSCIFSDEIPVGETVLDVPVRGGMKEACPDASVAVVPVALAENISLSDRFDQICSAYQKVVLIPDLKADIFMWALPRTLGSIIGLEISSNLLNPFARLVKRAMDMAIVLVLLPVWLPLLGILSLVIGCVERSNPFFLQHRVGRRSHSFRPVKFRTMVGNAEEVLEQALLNDETLRLEWEQGCKLKSDPRVTRVGKFLRRTSLDELPQVLNVLCGQMSLVGPRPLPDYHHEKLAEAARGPRVRVRPGITGLWQVSGRSDSGTAGMEKWDTFYVRNWSIWLDIVILARTVSAVFKGTGAY